MSPAKAAPLEDDEVGREYIFGERTCTVCGRSWPANTQYFGIDVTKRDGLTSACRECRRKAYTATNHRRRAWA